MKLDTYAHWQIVRLFNYSHIAANRATEATGINFCLEADGMIRLETEIKFSEVNIKILTVKVGLHSKVGLKDLKECEGIVAVNVRKMLEVKDIAQQKGLIKDKKLAMERVLGIPQYRKFMTWKGRNVQK